MRISDWSSDVCSSDLPNDHAVASALADLQPYALIATEQGIARGDLGEARRLLALMERIDPQAPSLPRLKGGIADIERIAAEHAAEQASAQEDRKSVVWGKGGYVRVELGGRRKIK